MDPGQEKTTGKTENEKENIKYEEDLYDEAV